jgi:hypothetical protein
MPDEKKPREVMSYEHSTGTTWWLHQDSRGELHAEILPKHCSWQLLDNGDLVIKTQIVLNMGAGTAVTLPAPTGENS